MPDVAIDSTIFRPATFIEMSLENLNRALLIGCVLVILVLIVFLYDWRTALISIIAIPLSLIAAALVLRYRGGTLNTMVIAGLVIALGEVVDDAIIDVENIVRRLRLNRGGGPSALGVPGRARRVARGPQRRRLRQPDRRPRVRAGLLPRGAGRLVLPPAGAVLRAGDPGVAARGADGDAGALAACCCRSTRTRAKPRLVTLPQGAVPPRAAWLDRSGRNGAMAIVAVSLGRRPLPRSRCSARSSSRASRSTTS